MLEKLERLADVFTVVEVGLLDGLGYDDKRGAVNRRVNVGVVGKNALQQPPVGDVAFIKDTLLRKGALPRNERVDDDGGMPAVLEGARHRAPDVTCAAGNQNFHRCLQNPQNPCFR